jgi:hypothetical protein
LFNLFGNARQREFKRLLAETQKRVEKEVAPTKNLCLAICQASVNCRDAVKDRIDAPTEAKRLELEVYVFYEFLYFYMHMAMRSTFGQLTEEQLRKLQSFLGPLVSSAAIDSYFGHWPDELKKKMRGEFYDRLNDAEVEYAEATRFDSSEQRDKRLTQKLQALFMKLGSNVSNLSGHSEHDLAMIVSVSEVAINEWTKMSLDNLVAEIKKVPPPNIENIPVSDLFP